MEKKSQVTSDEWVFTFEDVVRVVRSKRKKAFQAALIGALLSIGFVCLRAPVYKAEATFKEGADRGTGAETSLRDLFNGASSSDPQAMVLMKSLPVLKKAVEKLGLQAEVEQKKGFLVARVWRRFIDNLRAERGEQLRVVPKFRFQNVSYEGEKKLSYWIRFEDETHYTVLEHPKKPLANGKLGEELSFGPVRLTLEKIPATVSLKKIYPLSINPWVKVARSLQSAFDLKIHKQSKSICVLEAHHRDPQFATQLLDTIMAAYQNHLEQEFEHVAKTQLGFLERRQEEFFHQLDDVFDEQIARVCENIENEGFLRSEEASRSIGQLYQQLVQREFVLDLNLCRIDEFAKTEKKLSPSDSLFEGCEDLFAGLQELRQQRDLLEISLQKQASFAQTPDDMQTKLDELKEIRERQVALKGLLASTGNCLQVAPTLLFSPERALVVWAEHLQRQGEPLDGDFSRYLVNHLRLLSVREKMVQERFFHESGEVPELEGIDLATARLMFVEYNKKLDECETRLRYFSELRTAILEPDFSISSLSALLKDELSSQLIKRAMELSARLKDEAHCSEKEAERGVKELSIQKEILGSHIEQLYHVEELQAGLMREKMRRLQKISVDCINRALCVKEEQLEDLLAEKRFAIQKEKELLGKKMTSLKEVMKRFPEKAKMEHWIQLRTEMSQKMMEGLAQIVEAKTLGLQMHQVTARPLEFATVTPFPIPPQIFLNSILGGLVFYFTYLIWAFLKTLREGFPVSREKFKALHYPFLGTLSSSCDGPDLGVVHGQDLATLRQIGLFLEAAPQGKRIGLLLGSGPDYAYALAENLGRISLKSLVLRFDFGEKYQKSDQPGFYQYWMGQCAELPIRRGNGFDYVLAGGYTPYGVEWISSKKMMEVLRKVEIDYDYIFLTFRSPLDHPEANAALRLVDKALVTTKRERLEDLADFLNWGNGSRLKFLMQEERV